MRTRKFKAVSDFCAHVLQAIEHNYGCTSQRKIACITEQDADNLDNILCHTATTLQEQLDVLVYSKENICSSSKTVIIAVYWSSVWVYLVFYRKNKHIHVIVLYRKNKMDGVHSIFNPAVINQ
jgi:hypothetical protein